ncbi:MAG: hypothetical protein H0T79_18220 [Deltaproteobacteria bacterium]|nr:hypothetical protein [Deltaproteobacteria bacterium]
MQSRGLLVRLEVKPGKEQEVEEFLLSALPLVREEAETTAWFALRFGKSEYGIFDVFPDDRALHAHLSGPVGQALAAQHDILFAHEPEVHSIDVLAEKRPTGPIHGPDTKGLLLTFNARSGKALEVEDFLRAAEVLVREEDETTAWFALRLDTGEYGIFDVFRDSGGRFKHLVGLVPRELAKNALSIFGSVPDIDMLDVRAEKLVAQPAQPARGVEQ